MSFLKTLSVTVGLCAFALQSKAQDFASDPLQLGFDTASVKTTTSSQGKIVKQANFTRDDETKKMKLFALLEQNFSGTTHTATMISATRKDFGYSMSAFKNNARDSLYRLVEFSSPKEGGRYVTLCDVFVKADSANTAILSRIREFQNDPASTIDAIKKRTEIEAARRRKLKADIE
jgi:hypothetical protein